MKKVLLVVALAAALPLPARVDERSDLKAQLNDAMKSMLAVQKA